jgi:hypothetical protein
MKRPRSSRSPKRASDIEGRPLDAPAREALKRCIGIVTRCGYSPTEAAAYVGQICRHLPRSMVVRGARTAEDLDLAAHVLTLWRQERGYVLPDGTPRPLSWRGKGPCIEALVQKVGRGLTLAVARAYLVSTHSLRRVGRRYLPQRLQVSHPMASASQQAHHLRVQVDLQRTLEYNTKAPRPEDRRCQYSADNPSIPIRFLPTLNQYTCRVALTTLNDLDVFMYNLSKRGRPGEPRCAAAAGMYLSRGTVVRKPRRKKRLRR